MFSAGYLCHVGKGCNVSRLCDIGRGRRNRLTFGISPVQTGFNGDMKKFAFMDAV